MTTFNVGDRVAPNMPGLPDDIRRAMTVEVLELGTCDDSADECILGNDTFRFRDPESGEDDWAHVSEFNVA